MKNTNFQKKGLILIILIALSLSARTQSGTITLSFSADNNGTPVNLSSVRVKNLTQNCDTMLYPPNFILVIDTMMTGLEDKPAGYDALKLSQNFPNPFIGQTSVELFLPVKDQVRIAVTDVTGQICAQYNGRMEAGSNIVEFTAGMEAIYFLSVYTGNNCSSITMINKANTASSGCKLNLKHHSLVPEKSRTAKSYFDYDAGDLLLLAGDAGNTESGFLDTPAENKNYIFQFATNIPCAGIDSLQYEGRYYHTIQIMSQCWMKENLDAGIMIPGNQIQSDNGILEKYCYGGNAQFCNQKGGLYLWDEVMQYTNLNGSQGICPEGWHIPTDEEVKILEGVADNQFSIGHAIWNIANTFRGYDAGLNLKSLSGWAAAGSGLDIFGFTAVSGGYWWANGFFENMYSCGFWTSTMSNQSLPWYRGLVAESDKTGRYTFDGLFGISVRCLKNQ